MRWVSVTLGCSPLVGGGVLEHFAQLLNVPVKRGGMPLPIPATEKTTIKSDSSI